MINSAQGPQQRSTIGVGSAGVGVSYMMCKVLSIDSDTSIANVIDQVGNQRQISTTRVFGKGDAPEVGENWIISQMFGDWMFAVHVQTG